MKININNHEFNFPWEKSTTSSGWTEFNEWWIKTIDSEYEESDDGEVVGYPTIRIETNLPQLVVIGVEYGVGIQFGAVKSDGVFEALWYCSPSNKQWMEFIDALRIAEHQFVTVNYCFGNPRWTEGLG
jgi:hypothetical protein